jgi:hypothetical protein
MATGHIFIVKVRNLLLIIQQERGTKEKSEVPGDGRVQLYRKRTYRKKKEALFNNIITLTSSTMELNFVGY